ncbi:MAG: cytochrome b [Boseongicola sp.]
MRFRNTENSYGFVARALHWITVLVIVSAFPLGILANGQDLSTDAGIRQAFLLFSLHKTTGIIAFCLGIVRLFWALLQPRPAPIHIERRFENTTASIVHWMLTIALIAVPLAGWLSHAASPDLAPIWWPFGQSLPFIPLDEASAERFAAIHRIFTKVLLAAVVLHIAGALKHLLIDHDDVFARMWRGTVSGPKSPTSQAMSAMAALLIWTTALTAGLLLNLRQPNQLAADPSEWPLSEGEVALVDGNGNLLGNATAFGFLLIVDPESRGDEIGTLDLTLLLDTLEGPESNSIVSSAAFPLLQFLGVLQGTRPTLIVSGPLMLGDLVEHAEFSVTVERSGARISGTAAVPGLEDAFLLVDAFAERP